MNSTNFTGGVIHIVDSFLTLPQNLSTTAVALDLTAAIGAMTLLNLSNKLDNAMDVTMFIPNNMAFQQIGGGFDNLTTNDLISIFFYHVVGDSVLCSTDLANGTFLPNLQGKCQNPQVALRAFNHVSDQVLLADMNSTPGPLLEVRVIDSNVYINNAKVIFPNVLTSNGVIHVIDRVLNPDDSSASIGGQAFAGATSASGVPFTSGVPTPTSSISLPSSGSTSDSTSGSTSGSTPSSTPGSTTGSGSGFKPHSNAGAIAGGVVGGVLLIVLGLFLFWFLRRKRAGRKSQEKSATSDSSGQEGAVVAVGRKETTKSYHKPELEATTKSYQKPELEAGAVSSINPQQKPNAQAMNETDTPMSRVRTELSGTSAPQGTTGTPASPTTTRREISTQEEQRRFLQEQEEEEARLTEIRHQRRTAGLEYQKKMAELEHEQRMAELDITAARLRSRNRTVSELEARANPGPGSPE